MHWAFKGIEFKRGRRAPRWFWKWRTKVDEQEWFVVYLWRMVLVFKTAPGAMTRFFLRRKCAKQS